MIAARTAPVQSRPRSAAGTLCIGILGTPVSSRNRGVLALGASLINLCREASGGGKVVLLLCHRDNKPAHFLVKGVQTPIPVVNARRSPRSRPREHLLWILCMSVLYRAVPLATVRNAIARSTPFIRTLRDSALVGDVRGGDSFSDIYGMRRFLSGFLLAWTVVLVRGSIVQFPQTFGPYKSFVARTLAKYLLRRSSVIIARDRASQKVAQDLVGPRKDVLLSPDVAFSLEPVVPQPIELDPPLSDPQLSTLNPQLIIGLNINGLMFNGGYNRNNMFGLKLDYPTFLTELLKKLLEQHDGEIWLVPHTYGPPESVESDPEACRRVRAALDSAEQARVRIVTGDYDCHEIKGVIGQCGFFIGSRMHACIAALSQGIPCTGVAYSMKFAGVFESVGVQDWVIDGRTTTTESAVARTIELFKRRDEVRDTLKARAQAAREELQKVFANLFASVQSSPATAGKH